MKSIATLLLIAGLLFQPLSIAQPVNAAEPINKGKIQSISDQLSTERQRLSILELRAQLQLLIGMLNNKPADFIALKDEIASVKTSIEQINNSIRSLKPSPEWYESVNGNISDALQTLEVARLTSILNSNPSAQIVETKSHIDSAISLMKGVTSESAQVSVSIPASVKIGDAIGPVVTYRDIDKITYVLECSNPGKVVIYANIKGGYGCNETHTVTTNGEGVSDIMLRVDAAESNAWIKVSISAVKNNKTVFQKTYPVQVTGGAWNDNLSGTTETLLKNLSDKVLVAKLSFLLSNQNPSSEDFLKNLRELSNLAINTELTLSKRNNNQYAEYIQNVTSTYGFVTSALQKALKKENPLSDLEQAINYAEKARKAYSLIDDNVVLDVKSSSQTVSQAGTVSFKIQSKGADKLKVSLNCKTGVELSGKELPERCSGTEQLWYELDAANFPKSEPSITVKSAKDGEAITISVAAYKNNKWIKTVSSTVTVVSNQKDTPLNLTLSPYSSAGSAGINLSWNNVPGAAKYRITHYRKDTKSDASVVSQTTQPAFSTGSYQNAGESLGYCYYHDVKVEALSTSGTVLSSKSDSACIMSNGSRSGKDPRNYVAPTLNVSLDAIQSPQEGSEMWVMAKFGTGIKRLKLYGSCTGLANGSVVKSSTCDGQDRLIGEVNVSGSTYYTWNFTAGNVNTGATTGSYRFTVEALYDGPGVGSATKHVTVTKAPVSPILPPDKKKDTGPVLPRVIPTCSLALSVPSAAYEGTAYQLSWISNNVFGTVSLYDGEVLLGTYPSNGSYTEDSSISSNRTYKVVGKTIQGKECSDLKNLTVTLPSSASVSSSATSKTILNHVYQRLLQLKALLNK